MIYDPKDVKRLRVSSIAVLGVLITKELWEEQGFFLTFNLWQIIIIGVFICCFFLYLFKDRNDYVQSKSIKSFTPTMVGLGVIVLNIGCYVYWYNS